jgi:hypothetical protein
VTAGQGRGRAEAGGRTEGTALVVRARPARLAPLARLAPGGVDVACAGCTVTAAGDVVSIVAPAGEATATVTPR